MVGEVRPIMSLHVRLALEDGATGVMTTPYSPDPVHLGSVSKKFFAQRTLERTAPLEAGHWLAARQDVVRLHVGLKRPALAKALTTSRAGIAVTAHAILCLIGMHAGKVAADGVPLHGRIFTQVATVNLVARLTETVYA